MIFRIAHFLTCWKQIGGRTILCLYYKITASSSAALFRDIAPTNPPHLLCHIPQPSSSSPSPIAPSAQRAQVCRRPQTLAERRVRCHLGLLQSGIDHPICRQCLLFEPCDSQERCSLCLQEHPNRLHQLHEPGVADGRFHLQPIHGINRVFLLGAQESSTCGFRGWRPVEGQARCSPCVRRWKYRAPPPRNPPAHRAG